MAELGLLPSDIGTISVVAKEIGGALHSFAENGLRHRDLRPAAILIRERSPLDLVITSFGSARLSEFDLDIVSPLETTRYTAPEAIAGGVAASSDWWSLGMILLEQVTQGACFDGVNDQAFLIHVLTNGAPIPTGLPDAVELLLRGLLARNRHERWSWSEVQRWIAGDYPEAPPSTVNQESRARRTIALGQREFGSPLAFALSAAEEKNWEEAKTLLALGAIETWISEAELPGKIRTDLRQLVPLEDISGDLKLAMALKALNPAMPLTCKGDIITPGWLLDHPAEGFALISGPIPDILKKRESELWLSRLKMRAALVRDRAKQLDIAVNEGDLQINQLCTSRSRLMALWSERRRLLPDTDHSGLISVLEKRAITEEDLILLLSSDASQFRSADDILDEASDLASRVGVTTFVREQAAEWMQKSRREIYSEIEKRLSDFSRCGIERIDDWADKFRIEKRLAISRALALLAVPGEQWKEPPRQSYVATLLEFYSKRITAAAMRGPLTRMLIGKTTARIDLIELNSAFRRSARLLEHVLLRNEQLIDIDPQVLNSDPAVEKRVRTLHSHATLYRRDTGIDGLYLGFPFLLTKDSRSSAPPRIAPVLLWPVKIRPEVGARGKIGIGFDKEREEIRLNPAFESLLSPQKVQQWKEALVQLLGRPALDPQDVMEAFADLADQTRTEQLDRLPAKDERIESGKVQLVYSAVLFHLAYYGQAVMEDLKNLRGRPPVETSLETLLRLRPTETVPEQEKVRELERYFTASSDPSQEAAVLESRRGAGRLVEGPPGTGKSQTIVNMVCDSIGRGKSLLIICQKQAALEVVHKRLVAEKLASRIVMVTDVNKDRRPIIEAVRGQVEALLAQPSATGAWRQQRHMTAIRIEQTESELDQYHGALHAEDEKTGLTYRQILSELIGSTGQSHGPIHSLPVRKIVGTLNLSEVMASQEVCGPLARLWLPADYEGSPFCVLKPFPPESPTISHFAETFAAFSKAEHARREIVQATPDAFRIEDSEPYLRWSEQSEKSVSTLTTEERGYLARWLTRLPLAAHIERLNSQSQDIKLVIDQLGSLNSRLVDAETVIAFGLENAELVKLKGVLDDLEKPMSWLAGLSVSRWLKARRWKKFVHSSSAIEGALRDAIFTESELRPVRTRLCLLRKLLGESDQTFPQSPSNGLLMEAQRIDGILNKAIHHTRMLASYPKEDRIYSMIRDGSDAAVMRFVSIQKQSLQRFDTRLRSLAALDALTEFFTVEWIEKRRREIHDDGSNAEELVILSEHMSSMPAYQRFRPRASLLSDQDLRILAALRAAAPALKKIPLDDLDEEVRRIISREARLAWKARIETERPALLFSAEELQTKIDSLDEADREMRRLNRRHLVEGVDLGRVRPLGQWEDITRLVGPRARRLREFVERGADLGLMALRPVWLMNPDVASRLLPLTKSFFDTVIYDEASQMPIEYALPSLYRSKQAIVSGDEKQMPPTNFFSSKIENDEAELYEGDDAEDLIAEAERDEVTDTWNRREIKDCPDLLQLAKTVLPASTLMVHYRSKYQELIQFSNSAFYGSKLSVPARHPDAEIRKKCPIEVIRANGVYHNQTNESEARRVVEFVAEYWRNAGKSRASLGVVTFNRKQADLIEELLEERAQTDERFRAVLANERERVDEGEDMGFFVKNVENVQGDERDIIVFSSTFGRNGQGTFRRSFGVLGQAGGERRLNVAVTRARERVVLVTSMPISEISDLLTTRRSASSPRDFLQGYFEYARCLSDGDIQAGRDLLKRLGGVSFEGKAAGEPEYDGFQKSVSDFITSLGCRSEPLHDTGAFGVDLAVIDPTTGMYGLGIECDAPRQALLVNARAREIWRPSVLSKSIGHVYRVSSKAWLEDPQGEKDALRKVVNTFIEGLDTP